MKDDLYGWYCIVGSVGIFWLILAFAMLFKERAVFKGYSRRKALMRLKLGLNFVFVLGPALMLMGEFRTNYTLLGMAIICFSLSGIGLCELSLKKFESSLVIQVAIVIFIVTGIILLGGLFLPYPSTAWWGPRVDWLEQFTYFIFRQPLTLGILYFGFLIIMELLGFYAQRAYFTSNKDPRSTEIHAPLWLARLFGSPTHKLQQSTLFSQTFFIIVLVLSVFIMSGLMKPIDPGIVLLLNGLLHAPLYLFARVREP